MNRTMHGKQLILSRCNIYEEISNIIKLEGVKKILVVCSETFDRILLMECFSQRKVQGVFFTSFRSNPSYEEILDGIKLARNETCEFIISIGGGSAIDVAKSINLFLTLNASENYLTQISQGTALRHLAIPTTAGTGSESTRFAVIYYQGEKQSICHEEIIPEYVILEPKLLKTLPEYQKKCTVLDALCQGIESYWSVNSTVESKRLARNAIELILSNLKAYLDGSEEAMNKIMIASNYSGQAINITQTTAAHAMSYKITSLYHLPHGHAVAICLPSVWNYLYHHTDSCVDPRGIAYLRQTLDELEQMLLANQTGETGHTLFKELLDYLGIQSPFGEHKSDIEFLTMSVNPIRMKNFPVILSKKVIKELYQEILVCNNTVLRNKKQGKFYLQNYQLQKDVRELQKYVLEILLIVDKFCKKNQITYYLGEGTLLGAIRHRGFIPWDDDVDILMKRADYDRFVKLAISELPDGYVLDSMETNPKHWTICAKVQMIRKTKFYAEKVGGLGLACGPSLDVFPLDEVPELNSRKQILLGKHISQLRTLLWNKTRYSRQSSIKGMIIRIINVFISVKHLHYLIRKYMTTYQGDDCQYITNWGSLYPTVRQTVHRDVYGSPRFIEFEGHILPIPQKAEILLSTIYGDYLSLPERCQRKAKHHFKIMDEVEN